ncbi:MAG: hypothetical protein MUF21_03165 [Gemmatimonadaceae bacterium]|nr:hypothetical protein [Gemmatimonadaceae bacterium]
MPLLSLTTAIALAACGGDRGAGDAGVARVDSAAPTFGDTALAAATPSPVVDSAPSPAVTPAPTPAPEPAPVAAAPTRRTERPARRPAPAPRPSRQDRAETPAPSPAPSAEAAPRRGSIAAGSSLRLSFGEKVCSRTLNEGDRVTATLASSVDGSNGVTLPSGARVTLVVTRSTSATNNDRPDLAFDVRSVSVDGESYDLNGSVSLDTLAIERQGGDAKKVAIGAAAGAVIGNIVGGGNRAVRTAAGAAAGGLAGAGVAAATGKRYACVPAGQNATVRTSSALSIPVR